MKHERIAGLSAAVFAISIFSINLVENVGTARPDPAASAEDVSQWAQDAGAYLWATTILVPVCWMLLAVFAAFAWNRARTEQIGMMWPTVGLLGSAMTMGTLSAAIAADAALIASADNLSLDVVEFLANFSVSLFLFNWAALALALFGLSRTTAALGISPRWLNVLSVVGAALLAIGSVQVGPVLNGFLPAVLIGLPGFVIWLVYLLVVGLRLVRTPEQISSRVVLTG